jgi:hypothetical protein
MISIIFKEEPVPQGMKITQSYGIIFNNQGQILLKVENKKGKQNNLLASFLQLLF